MTRFNLSRTAIDFALPHASAVALRIYDAGGRLVRELANGRLPAGRHAVRWDGRDAGGQGVAAGVYFYRIETGEFRAQRRLVRID